MLLGTDHTAMVFIGILAFSADLRSDPSGNEEGRLGACADEWCVGSCWQVLVPVFMFFDFRLVLENAKAQGSGVFL